MNNDMINDKVRQMRFSLTNEIREVLLGPGSEISYPDAEHELISERPQSRYSVGILFPQNTDFDSNNGEEKILNNDNKDESLSDDIENSDQTLMEKIQNKYLANSLTSDIDDDSIDAAVNMSTQYKPSSLGMTFFVDKDIRELSLIIEYAKYNQSNLDPITFKNEYQSITSIPAELSDYISYNEKENTFTKLNYINVYEIDNIFELNHIENPDLMQVLKNINQVFKFNISFRRVPENLKATIMFESNTNFIKKEINGDIYLSMVKRKVNDSVYSITVMLVNNGSEHIFQPKMRINTEDNDFNFLPYNKIFNFKNLTDEEQTLDLLYRNKEIFATGHGVSVDWHVVGKKGNMNTEFLPSYERSQISLNKRNYTKEEIDIDDKVLSMKYLSDLNSYSQDEKLTNLQKFINTYNSWIESNLHLVNIGQIERNHILAANMQISKCKESYNRMIEGISILRNNSNAWSAFLLANKAMFMQRIHVKKQTKDHLPGDQEFQNEMKNLNYMNESEEDRMWRPFQIAFILMSINSIVDPNSNERDIVDLIWFPTGGGKTEAYLGLTAFTIFYRKLSDLKTSGGTAVIMRYTLRLLTSQQFTRASTLICACEKIRRDEEGSNFLNYPLGSEEISIGLWIGGQHAPNTNRNAKDNFDKLDGSGDLKYRLDKYNKFQVLKCPWCGTKLTKETHGKRERGAWGYHFIKGHFFLSCTQEDCEFEKKLPIQIVDEELYKKPPTLLFGTVDKFAMLPWKEDVNAFFGNIDNKPPDLIIQDELHLISGPLGTIVGLYEVAIDYLCTNNSVKPKIIASTATICQPEQQIKALYNREVRQFPQQGLDIEDSFFAKEVSINDKFGRLYFGIMASGLTKVMIQARLLASLLQYVSDYDDIEEVKDKFWTLTLYFNNIKELGKSSSILADDVKDFIRRLKYRQIYKLGKTRSMLHTTELTSRVSTSELNDTLERLISVNYSNQNYENKNYPIDVLLATNMISVGIDVSRLNLMVLMGQPKSTSEYIQASSRIGRSNPGLAITLFDNTKSRDRSHYEQYLSYNQSVYKYVEPSNITPFSDPAIDRGLHAILISMLRHKVGILNKDEDVVNINDGSVNATIKHVIEYIYDRTKSINANNPKGMIDNSLKIKKRAEEIIDIWRNRLIDSRKAVYGDSYIMKNYDKSVPRLIKSFGDLSADSSFKTLTSMRNVEASIPVSVLYWEDEDNIYED